MKLYTKRGTKEQINREERSLILGGYSHTEKRSEKDLQPFEYIKSSEDHTDTDVTHKISWLQ